MFLGKESWLSDFWPLAILNPSICLGSSNFPSSSWLTINWSISNFTLVHSLGISCPSQAGSGEPYIWYNSVLYIVYHSLFSLNSSINSSDNVFSSKLLIREVSDSVRTQVSLPYRSIGLDIEQILVIKLNTSFISYIMGIHTSLYDFLNLFINSSGIFVFSKLLIREVSDSARTQVSLPCRSIGSNTEQILVTKWNTSYMVNYGSLHRNCWLFSSYLVGCGFSAIMNLITKIACFASLRRSHCRVGKYEKKGRLQQSWKNQVTDFMRNRNTE